MIKFNGKYHAESPEEAQKLDHKRFQARQKSREYLSQIKREELTKATEGNKKLPYFE